MFVESSLFGKTLARILSPDQSAAIETAVRRSRSFRHRAKVHLVVQSVDIVAGLSDDQRARLTELLLRETRPARNSFVDFDVEIVLAQTSMLPEAKIRPIFDRQQWQVVAPILQGLKQNYQATLHDIPLARSDDPPPPPAETARARTAPAGAEPTEHK